jgi:hypothetical protein
MQLKYSSAAIIKAFPEHWIDPVPPNKFLVAIDSQTSSPSSQKPTIGPISELIQASSVSIYILLSQVLSFFEVYQTKILCPK